MSSCPPCSLLEARGHSYQHRLSYSLVSQAVSQRQATTVARSGHRCTFHLRKVSWFVSPILFSYLLAFQSIVNDKWL